MKKLLITFLLQLVGILFLQAQFSALHFSMGTVRSDYRKEYNWDNDCNKPKIGFFTSLGADLRLFKKVELETNVTYQERKALEEFQSGITFCKYPTSPQSDLYNAALYAHFPNFKYLNLEILPTYKLGKRFQVSLGLGAFGGLLINEAQTKVIQEDFAEGWQSFFGPPWNTTGKTYTTQYEKWDYGWVGKLAVNYAINPRIRMGLSLKTYYSIADLETGIQYAIEKYWVADLIGIDFYYCFLGKKK